MIARHLLAPLGAALALMAAPRVDAAEPTGLRLATLAPEGGSWMKILGKSAADLDKKSSKRVVLRYYAGGVQGDERDVVRKINLGQLDGGLLTGVGLAMIDDSIRVLEVPRMFESIEEVDYVADKMWPYFQKKFEAKGFQLAGRAEVGWVHVFSTQEVKSLDALKARKVWLTGDDAIVGALYKQLGVSGVPLAVTEVESALTSGRIDTVYGSPLAVVALRWNDHVKAMSAIPVAFGIGALVVKNDAMDKLSKEDRALFEKLDRSASKELRKQVRKDDDSAKKQLERKGLKVTVPSAEDLTRLEKAAAAVTTELTGKVYSKAELQMVLDARIEYRAKNGGK